MINFKKNKYRVRRSVNPTNRIIASEHGVRQVLFPYGKHKILGNLNVSVFGFTRIKDFDEEDLTKISGVWGVGFLWRRG